MGRPLPFDLAASDSVCLLSNTISFLNITGENELFVGRHAIPPEPRLMMLNPTGKNDAKRERREMILGMPGPWAEDNLEPSDHYTTKVGGLPDWAMPAEDLYSEYLKCGSCRGDLGLVAQVYAPLKIRGVDIDERTLYIFGCPSSSCGINPLSWRTIRVQGSSSTQSNVRALGTIASSSVGESTRESSEPERESASDQQQHVDEWWEDDTWEPGVVGRGGYAERDAFLAMEELETALLEAGYAAAVPLVTSNINTEDEFTAVNEDIAAETEAPDLPVLPCFYVYSQRESHPSRGSRAVLALELSERSEAAALGRDDSNIVEEVWEGEEYEPDRALSADRTYLKFKKRLDCYPEQCFRYCFKGTPLWATRNEGEPGVCSQCGGPRVYEMQLMPPLLYYLQQASKDLPSTSHSPNDWEWLTLIVFTCAQSCTPSTHGSVEDSYGEGKPWFVVEEGTIVQYEN